jgi:hypothetical protein
MSSNAWKETLNIDCYQVHQYQQNEHLILTEIAKHKKPTTLEIQVLAWDMYIRQYITKVWVCFQLFNILAIRCNKE